MPDRKKTILGVLSLLLCSILWGSTFVAQVFGANTLSPLSYNAARFLIGGFALIPLVYYRARRGTLKRSSVRKTLWGAFLCGTVLFAGSYFQQRGMSATGAGKAGFISALYIVLVPLLRSFSGERPRFSAWMSVFVALIGMYFLCIPVGGATALSYSDFLILISALFFSLHILFVDRFVGDLDPILLSSLQFLITAFLSAIFSVGEHTSLADLYACRWPILYAGILSCGIAYTLQVVGQRVVEPLQASLLLSLESVFSAVSGALVLSERFTSREGIGCILIFAAVVYGQCGDAIKRFIISRRAIS